MISPIQAALIWLVTLMVSWGLLVLLANKQVLDIPNARSSHGRPTPKGGGIGFILVIGLVVGWLAITKQPAATTPLLALAFCTLTLSLVGLLDDLRNLPARVRFSLQIALSLVMTGLTFGSSGQVAIHGMVATTVVFALAVLFLAWCSNLYNFMDGIDGIAALQGILSGLLVYSLGKAGWYPGSLADLGLLIAASCSAFLLFNFPPANMFMGDAGSAALGFLLAGVALLEFTVDANALWIWIISLAGFIADATATLMVRILRGQKFYQAHRSHLYQLYTAHIQAKHLAQGADPEQARTLAHRRCLLMFCVIFLVWQLPLGVITGTGLLPGFWAAAICLLPLLAGAVVLGAGRDQLTAAPMPGA